MYLIAFQLYQVSLPGGTRREPVLQIPDGEIYAFHRHISLLLSRYTAYELLPESGKVRVLFNCFVYLIVSVHLSSLIDQFY